MRIASCLFTLAVLLAGCGGDEPAPESAEASPIVEKSTPAPRASEPAAGEGTRLTVLFTNNVDGEIEPCG